jgi:hypothetical protein
LGLFVITIEGDSEEMVNILGGDSIGLYEEKVEILTGGVLEKG